jgi:hypothetical protein
MWLSVARAGLMTAASFAPLFSITKPGFEASVSAFWMRSSGSDFFVHDGCSIRFGTNSQAECDASASDWCAANIGFMATGFATAWVLVGLDAAKASYWLRTTLGFVFVTVVALALGLLTAKAEGGARSCGFLPADGQTTLLPGAYLGWAAVVCGAASLAEPVTVQHASAGLAAAAAGSLAAFVLPLGSTGTGMLYPWAPVAVGYCVDRFDRLFLGNKVLSLLIALFWLAAAGASVLRNVLYAPALGVIWLLLTILVSWNAWAFDTSETGCGFGAGAELGPGWGLYAAEWLLLTLLIAVLLVGPPVKTEPTF